MSPPDVVSVILGHAGDGGGRPAVRDTDEDLSYGDLADQVHRAAAGLAHLGVAPGDRVALHLPNSVDFVVAALACLWTGAVFVPLATTDPPARLRLVLDDCAPAVVVTSDRAGGGAGADPGPDGRSWVTVSDLRRSKPGRVSPPRPPGGPAYAIYTSGTTGSPKGVLIGTPAFTAAVAATVDALGLDASTRTLCVSPFHFDGSFATLFPTLYAGGAVVIRPREALLFPRTFFRAVDQEAITYTGFSPSYLKLLHSSPEKERLAPSTLVVALGGEAASVADIRALWEVAPGVRVFNRYGPTETTIAVTHVAVTPGSLAGGPVPLGRPHPGVTFHLVDADGRLIDAADQVGELYIGGSQLMEGYWGAPELTARVLRDDVVPGVMLYRTGDLVYRTGAGEYVYVDRADRVIKRHGVRISLIELGEALGGLDGVSAAACVPYADGDRTGIVAYVVTDHPVEPLELRRAAGRILPETMLPDRIEPVGDLPLTRSGKLDEGLLLGRSGLHPVRTAGPQTVAAPPG